MMLLLPTHRWPFLCLFFRICYDRAESCFCFPSSLPAVHLFKLADAGAFDGRGGRGVVKRQGVAAASSFPQFLSGNSPHRPRWLLRGLLWLVCVLFGATRRHGLKRDQLGNMISAKNDNQNESSLFRLHFLVNIINVAYTAAESKAGELRGVLSRPCIAILLWQQQDKGHSQGQMVEAVDVGVVPLLQWPKQSTSGAHGLNSCKFIPWLCEKKNKKTFLKPYNLKTQWGWIYE